MILVSRKVDYGVLALHHLMLSPDGASARELADLYGLSRAFIANILKELCQEGLVTSHRGVHGGYRLAKPPQEITLEAVVTALDGPFQLMSCASDTGDQACDLAKLCPVKSPLRLVHDKLRKVLSEVTLEDLRNEPGSGLVALPTEKQTNGCPADLPG